MKIFGMDFFSLYNLTLMLYTHFQPSQLRWNRAKGSQTISHVLYLNSLFEISNTHLVLYRKTNCHNFVKLNKACYDIGRF